jgi:hypothetical protein
MTGLALISSALKTLGALASGETADPDEAADALLRLNDWIDALATQDFTIYYLLRTVVPLINGTTSYTIGTGGVINIARPTEITQAALILNNGAAAADILEIPIAVYTDQEWAAIGMKGMAGTYPGGIYFDHNWVGGLAKIYPLMVPNVNTTSLVLYTPAALAQMTLSGNVTFPPGYARLLRYGLARELSPEFGGWDSQKESLYLDAMGDVQRKNLRMTDLLLPPALVGRGMYNINTDTP